MLKHKVSKTSQNPPWGCFFSEGTYVLRWLEFTSVVLQVGEYSVFEWLWGSLDISIVSGSVSHAVTLSLLPIIMNHVDHSKIDPTLKLPHVPPVLVKWCITLCRGWQLIFRGHLKKSLSGFILMSTPDNKISNLVQNQSDVDFYLVS